MIHRKETSQMDKTLPLWIHVCYTDYAIHHYHVSLHLRCMHLGWYISLLSLILISLPYIDGDTRNHTRSKGGDWEEVNEGDIMMMEVDLRGEGRERTLHFFISGRQQKIYFYNLPAVVEFCVCYHYFILFVLFFFSFYFIISSSLLLFSSISIVLIKSV